MSTHFYHDILFPFILHIFGTFLIWFRELLSNHTVLVVPCCWHGGWWCIHSSNVALHNTRQVLNRVSQRCLYTIARILFNSQPTLQFQKWTHQSVSAPTSFPLANSDKSEALLITIVLPLATNTEIPLLCSLITIPAPTLLLESLSCLFSPSSQWL